MFSKQTPFNLTSTLPDLSNRNQINSLKAQGVQPRPGAAQSPNLLAAAPAFNLPQHVTEVRCIAVKASDISTKVTVTYSRSPADPMFAETLVYVSGYKGNPAPCRIASGQSPVSFNLDCTGEPVTVTVQASGNLGQAPLSTAPSTTLQLARTNLATVPTQAGNGPGSSAPNFGLVNPYWRILWDGSNYSFSNSGNGVFGTSTANEVKFTLIRVYVTEKLTTMVTRILSGTPGTKAACGIYDLSGNKLGSWDNFSVATGGSTVTATKTGGGSLILPPGVYIAANAADNAGGAGASSLGGCQASGTNEGVMPWNSNGTVRTGFAANAMVSGVMPATLGALTAGGSGLTVFPNILLEP